MFTCFTEIAYQLDWYKNIKMHISEPNRKKYLSEFYHQQIKLKSLNRVFINLFQNIISNKTKN